MKRMPFPREPQREESFEDKVNELVMASFDVKCRFFERSTADIARAARLLIAAMRAGGKLLIFGNGGSAADSQHIAAELVFKMGRDRAALPAIALTTDTSLLTAISNDRSFQFIFSRQIAALGRRGDVALAISTSGNSPNVVEGVKQARQMEMRTIGLLGGDGGRVASLVDLPLIVPSLSTPCVQQVHIEVGHILCQLIEDELFSR
jgi:D-sedoheptulose 7-phosphate isomerase